MIFCRRKEGVKECEIELQEALSQESFADR